MNVMAVVALGLCAGAAFGALAWLAALTRTGAARAGRAGLAAAMGGAIASTLTALVQLPFFAHGAITVPLAVAGVAGAVAAGGAASLILRAKPVEPLQTPIKNTEDD